MTTKTSFKTALDGLSETDRETLRFSRDIVIGHVIFGILRAGVVHAVGRKLAPNVFTSFGRTYALSVLARAIVHRPELSEDQKKRLSTLRTKLVDQRDAQVNGFGDYDDIIKG